MARCENRQKLQEGYGAAWNSSSSVRDASPDSSPSTRRPPEMTRQGEAAAEGEPGADPMVGATRTRPSLASTLGPSLDPRP